MKWRTLFSVFVLSLGLGAFQNCAKAQLSSQSSNSDGTSGQFGDLTSCTQVLNTTTTPTRLIFVVDQSGSNQTGTNAGTDPNKVFRAGSIQAFFNDYQSKAAFGWGFLGFQNSAATSFITSNGQPTLSTNAADMQAAINRFLSIKDAGGTPYQAALSGVRDLISRDQGGADTDYLVIFLSDGVPIPRSPTSIWPTRSRRSSRCDRATSP